MNAIKSWAALIAATSIVAAVFLALVPGGKMRTAFSTLVGIVFVCALISPFSQSSDLSFDFDDELFSLTENGDDYINQSDEAAKAVAQSGYKKAIDSALQKLGYSDFKAEVVCGDNMAVESVEVIFADDFSEEKVNEEIKKLCGNAQIKLSKGEEDER